MAWLRKKEEEGEGGLDYRHSERGWWVEVPASHSGVSGGALHAVVTALLSMGSQDWEGEW